MPTIIYHQIKPGVDCPDGLAASWTVSLAHPGSKILGWCYQTEPPAIEELGEKVIIVDFSFPRAVIEGWVDAGIEVEIIDHHPTALDHLSGLSDRILFKYDDKECGATLAWKHFFPDKPMPVFLEYVRDRDLWDKLLPYTEEVHEAVAALRRTFALYDRLAMMTKEELLWFLLPIGDPLVAPKRAKVAEIAARHEWKELAGYRIPVVTLDKSEERFTSDVCAVLYNQYPDAPFSACITSDGSWSLRSNKHGNNFDVRAIAEQFQGGGHLNASGFRPQQEL